MRTLAWCLALVLPACFDNAPEVETLGGDGGGSSTVGEASTSGSDTATAESSDSGGVSSSLGTVSLRSARVPADSVANLSASFGSGLDDCSSEGQAVGPCSISACGVDMVQRPDAGTIGFDRNGAVQAPQLEPGALGHYMPVQLSMAPFLPGDEVGVHASGGEVPGFDVLVSAPPGVKFDQNAVDLVLNASSPLTVTWVPPPPDAAGDSSVVVRMRAPMQAATCLVNANVGELEIPAEVFQSFGPGANVQLEAFTQRDAPVTVSPWEVTVVLAYQIEDSTNAPVFGPRTIE